jgi:hypothetical protein
MCIGNRKEGRSLICGEGPAIPRQQVQLSESSIVVLWWGAIQTGLISFHIGVAAHLAK